MYHFVMILATIYGYGYIAPKVCEGLTFLTMGIRIPIFLRVAEYLADIHIF